MCIATRILSILFGHSTCCSFPQPSQNHIAVSNLVEWVGIDPTSSPQGGSGVTARCIASLPPLLVERVGIEPTVTARVAWVTARWHAVVPYAPKVPLKTKARIRFRLDPGHLLCDVSAFVFYDADPTIGSDPVLL
jgi:hypothetical protein